VVNSLIFSKNEYFHSLRSVGAIAILIFALCDVAYADNNALEQWRSKAGSIRQLLENDAPQAYAEVKRLRAELPFEATPSDRVRLLNLLSRIENSLGETDSSAAYAQQAFDLAKQHDDKAGQAEADINIALNAVNQGNIDAMIAADTHSLAILDGVDRPDLLAEAMLRGSMMYTRLEKLEESVAIAVQAMEIARRGNDDWVLAYAYQGMAVAYDQNGHYAEARDNYAKMLKHARDAHSKTLEGTALNGIGATLNHLDDYQEGARLIRSAVDLYRAVGAPFYLARSLFVLAENLRKQGSFAEALPFFDESAAIFRQRFNKIGLWWSLYQRSANYLDLGKMAQADADAQDAYRLAKEIKFPVYLSKSARRLSAISAARGDYRQAYRLSAEADELSAKAASDNSGKHMVELTKRYETESKQREIDKLNRSNQQQATELAHRTLEQRWLWTVLGGSVVMLAGIGFFLLRLRGSHRRLKELNTQALQAKNKLQATLDTIPDLLFEIGLDGRYYDYHSPRTDLLLASFEDLHDKTVADAMPADAAKIVMSALQEAHQLGISIGKQFQLTLPRGDFWFELSVASKPVADGEEPRLIVLSRNITERKHMEAQALQREQEFRVLVENSPDLIFRYDKDCRRIYTNPSVARLVGKWAEGLLNQSPSEAKILSNDQADKLIQMIRQVLATGLTAESEVECLDSNGQLHYFHNRYAPEFNAHGEVVSVISIARDVTERKRAEDEIHLLNADLEQRVLERTEELRLQTRYLRTLIDTLPMMAWLKDKESRFLVVNQAMALACGRSVNELIGKSDLDCWPREHAEAYRADDAEVMTAGRRKTVEELFVDARDGAIWVETCKAPVFDEDGSVLGTVGTARDISDRKAMETAREAALAEAERLAKLRSEFMARMSHELRTPLNGIMGYAQILLGEHRGNERHSAMLNVIQQSGEYLLNLINDILDFAKIEAGKQELSFSDVQLRRFLGNLAGIITIKAEQKGLVFVCDIAEDVPAGIRVDETRLRQVLLNLLSNAVKYSERGQISLRVTRLAAGGLRLEVQDNGIGIEAGQLETIFHAFEQAGDTQYRTGGTGLGLPISRELVRMMGGDIQVVSRVGEGSTFWFDLEASVVEVGEDITATEYAIAGYSGLRRRVLVVDDDDDNRALLIDMLRRLGLDSCEAANGSACLDSVESQAPDLVLLDMAMPEMDGLETARRLRRLPDFGQTPIIAVSAHASADDIAEAGNAGVNVFLSKPVDIKRLMAQLAVLLKLDWIYAQPETAASPRHRLNDLVDVPPHEEMNILYRLAQEGSMRDIIRQTVHLEELDPRYSPFAGQLRVLAQNYQSKAILELVERHITTQLR